MNIILGLTTKLLFLDKSLRDYQHEELYPRVFPSLLKVKRFYGYYLNKI
ncbi:MAG: hypothetical protein ACO1OF_10960 [Adhaeribacter sp.]